MKRSSRWSRSSKGKIVLATIVLLLAGCFAGGYFAWRMGVLPSLRPPLEVEELLSGIDGNANGIDDSLDIVDGARRQVEAKPVYRSAYYQGGYPPEGEGVCTDLVWRALWNAGYDLKTSVDLDIARAVDQYPRVGGSPDPNIDFRRVPNLYSFLVRMGESLPIEADPWDATDAVTWQPGDIVIFGSGYDHIGIVSNKRKRDGIPLVIHHGWGRPVEDNALEYWKDDITGHFRLDLTGLEKS